MKDNKNLTTSSPDQDDSARSTDDDFVLRQIIASRSQQDEADKKGDAKLSREAMAKLTSTKTNDGKISGENDQTDRSEDDVFLLKIVAARSQRTPDTIQPSATAKIESAGSETKPTASMPAGPEFRDTAKGDSRLPQKQQPDDAPPAVLAGSEEISAAPGAYREGNGPRELVEPVARHSSRSNLPMTAASNSDEMTMDTVTAGLVVANAVPDGEDLENAQPIDPEQAQQKRNGRTLEKKPFFCAMGWFAIAMAIVVGLVFAFKSDVDDDTSSVPRTPTFPPSTSPTSTPSSAPTGPLDTLFSILPSHSQENIEVFGTPQQKAWDWLMHHPNATILPVWRQQQLFSLVTFYHAFEGPNWPKLIRDKWLDYEKEECQWFSSGFGYFDYFDGSYVEETGEDRVESCNKNSEFESLHLENLQLGGLFPAIPPEVFLLTSLSRIDLNLNRINVSFASMWPSEPITAPNVTFLSAFANDLSGTLPGFVALQLVNLQEIRMWDNKLTGSIPSELMLLTSMTSLKIEGSSLTGTVPSELGLMTDMSKLSLFGNLFSGTIPTEFGLMTSVVEIDFNGNQLVGTIPSELGLTSLSFLGLANNRLSGAIPRPLAALRSLAQLQLQNNLLSGTLPLQLNASMPGLNLGGNQFTGGVPQHLCGALACECYEDVILPSQCLYLQKEPEWPGRLPIPISTEGDDGVPIMINLKTDLWPEETEWFWEEEGSNGTDVVWKIVEDSGGYLKSSQFLHSYPVVVAPNSAYRLIVSDIYKDGLYDPGFITLTAANGTAIYSLIGRVSFDVGDPNSNFATLSVLVSMNDNGSIQAVQI